jgi:hypothetical protein
MSVTKILDQIYDVMVSGSITEGMVQMFEYTNRFAQGTVTLSLSNLWQSDIASHPVTDLIHQDPFTYHSYTKPRGYAGDAELLDYIYGLRPPEYASEIGQKIFNFTTNTSAPASVRLRCRVLAKYIDNLVLIYPPHCVFCP